MSNAASTSDGDGGLVTAQQMRTYAAERVAAERERCAKVCAKVANDFGAYRDHYPQRDGALACEQAIRSGETP